ncbi:MAG: hypothetical protein CK604_07070 [Curvibacter sp. PD_MW3]|nr:MAG: hypothetical protein CK604_07070 [Curvibacter sp. PD_MW3]
MSEILAQVAFVMIAALAIAPMVFYASSLLYVGFRFRQGSISFLVKTLVIGLMTVPVAILVTLWAILHFAAIGALWMRRILAKCTGKAIMTVADTESPHQPDDVVVHLVHGTFESNADWTNPDSPLCKAILTRNPSVRLSRFIWSGLNTHRARREAADLFAGQVLASPSRKQYVVAHSHAGNIVRDASERVPAIAQKIQGVALLSTPFIFRKTVERTGRGFVFTHSMGFAVVVQLPLALALVPFDAYGPVVAGLSMVLATLIEMKISQRFQAELNKELEIENGDVELRDVQILHAIGDEADSLLRFVSFLHESCFGLFSQLQATARQMSGHEVPHLVALGILAIAMAGTWLSDLTGRSFWISAIGVVAVGVLGAYLKERYRPSGDQPMVLMMMALPVGFISFWLAAAKSLAYGDWRLLFCPSIFISSSETPVGGQHNPIKYAPDNDGMLVHSTHSHRKAIRDVAEWLYMRETSPTSGTVRSHHD